MSNYFDVEKAWLRDVILGKIKFKKCMKCDADGKEWWSEEGVLLHPSQANPEKDNSGPCEVCDGLGYVEKNDGEV